jgi:hypothetical protein
VTRYLTTRSTLEDQHSVSRATTGGYPLENGRMCDIWGIETGNGRRPSYDFYRSFERLFHICVFHFDAS